MEQQNSDGLPSHSGNQSPLDGFFGHQPHRPSGAALRGIATNHRDNALPLAVLQQRSRSGPLLLIQRTFEAPFAVAMADLPNRLWRERNSGRNARRADAVAELQKRYGAQDNSHLLHAAAQQRFQLFLILLGDFDPQGGTGHI